MDQQVQEAPAHSLRRTSPMWDTNTQAGEPLQRQNSDSGEPLARAHSRWQLIGEPAYSYSPTDSPLCNLPTAARNVRK